MPNTNFETDMFNVLVGIAWQMSMVVMPLYFAFRQWGNFGICLVILIATSVILKFSWYDKLEND